MENQILKAHYLGTYKFMSKDKTKEYFKLQAVAYTENRTKALIIDTFVTEEDYNRLLELDYFVVIDLQLGLNLETGKISYKML